MSHHPGKGSSFSVAGLGLLALLGWFRSTGPLAAPPAAPGAGAPAAGSSSASSPASAATAVTNPPAPGQPPAEAKHWQEPLRLYEEFFGLPRDPALDRAAAIARLTGRLASRADADPSWQPWKLRFMVALVPDPLDSQLPATFDQAIDAIGQGLAYSNRPPADNQAAGRWPYLPDRSWLPWNDEQAVKDKAYQAAPGLLLFRRFRPGDDGRQERQLLGVFLVGETPKTGIHQAAFHEALQLITDLSVEQAQVNVLGPTFSGSAESLRTALLNWLDEHPTPPGPRFVIVTGSARAPCLETLLSGGLLQAVSFYRAVVPLDVLLQTALEDLRDRMGWDLRKLVLITELDTAFGQSVRRKISTAQMEPDSVPEGCQSEITAGRILHFPSHILAIRSARAAAGLDKTPPDPNQIGSQPNPVDLPLNLAPGPAGADVVPDFSPLTAPATEIAIAGLVGAIERDDVRYVGILATDVSDTLFLADRIRRQVRNITLFALEGDQLFLHPQVHSAVNGMTLLSSSPLRISGGLLEEDAGGRPGQPPWQLANTFGNGIFEAAAELVSDQNLDRSLRDFAHNDAGPIWTSVVGNDAIWPLWRQMSPKDKISPDAKDRCAPDAKDQSADGQEMVLSFDCLVRRETGAAGGDSAPSGSPAAGKSDFDLLLFAVVMCLGAWMLHRAALLPGPPRAAGAERGTRWLLAAGVGVLVLAGAVLVALGLPHWEWKGPDLEPTRWALRQDLSFAGLVVVYLGLLLALIFAVAVRRPRRGARPRLRRWGAAVVTLLAGLAVVPLLVWAICRRWMLCGVAFDERVRAFASGLSPLVSLFWLVAALYLWSLLELERRRLTAWQRIDWPLAEAFEPALRGSSRLLGTIRWLLSVTVAASWWRRLALAVVVAASLGAVWHPMQPAAERPEFGRLMLALWTIPAVLSAISCYRFVRVWQTLRKLLVRIASTPLASRLETLSEALRWKPMQALTWPIPPFDTLILSLVRLRELRSAGTVALTEAELRDLNRFLALAFKAEAREKARMEIVNRERLERLIAAVSGQLALSRDQSGVEDFFAIRVAAYLRYVFAQLRSSLMSALGPALLALLAVAAYTFEPKGAVSLGFLVLVLGEIVIAVSILVAMNRDTVLSLIAGNSPGEVTFDWHFLSSLLTFGVLPLLALIGTQIPAAGQLLNGWLKPLLHLAGIG
jgi:hypothetical protein